MIMNIVWFILRKIYFNCNSLFSSANSHWTPSPLHIPAYWYIYIYNIHIYTYMRHQGSMIRKNDNKLNNKSNMNNLPPIWHRCHHNPDSNKLHFIERTWTLMVTKYRYSNLTWDVKIYKISLPRPPTSRHLWYTCRNLPNRSTYSTQRSRTIVISESNKCDEQKQLWFHNTLCT